MELGATNGTDKRRFYHRMTGTLPPDEKVDIVTQRRVAADTEARGSTAE